MRLRISTPQPISGHKLFELAIGLKYDVELGMRDESIEYRKISWNEMYSIVSRGVFLESSDEITGNIKSLRAPLFPCNEEDI
jgi:hypothetical protein